MNRPKKTSNCGRVLRGHVPRAAVSRPTYAEDMSYLVRCSRMRLERGVIVLLH
jgi:hypothetical protein